jgi:hypothetical protein
VLQTCLICLMSTAKLHVEAVRMQQAELQRVPSAVECHSDLEVPPFAMVVSTGAMVVSTGAMVV